MTSSRAQGAPPTGYRRGESDERPWGRWEVLDVGPGFCAKRITVEPGHRLSLQRHRHRSEHWLVARGVARVTNGDDVFDLGVGQSTDIPVGAVHRLENAGTERLELIEVQLGDVLDENDIERLEDGYGRR